MSFMEWSDRYSVGVAVFDDEHKKLIAIINELYEAVAAGVDKLALQRVSDKLVEYTLMHFRHEETYFDDWGYPHAAAHIAYHTKLRQQVFEYRRKILEEDSKTLALEMLDFLRDWLSKHIMTEDRRYGAFLHNKGLH